MKKHAFTLGLLALMVLPSISMALGQASYNRELEMNLQNTVGHLKSNLAYGQPALPAYLQQPIAAARQIQQAARNRLAEERSTLSSQMSSLMGCSPLPLAVFIPMENSINLGPLRVYPSSRPNPANTIPSSDPGSSTQTQSSDGMNIIKNTVNTNINSCCPPNGGNNYIKTVINTNICVSSPGGGTNYIRNTVNTNINPTITVNGDGN